MLLLKGLSNIINLLLGRSSAFPVNSDWMVWNCILFEYSSTHSHTTYFSLVLKIGSKMRSKIASSSIWRCDVLMYPIELECSFISYFCNIEAVSPCCSTRLHMGLIVSPNSSWEPGCSDPGTLFLSLVWLPLTSFIMIIISYYYCSGSGSAWHCWY